jgi:hypothetical protein
MPDYIVSLIRRIELTGTVIITAKDENTANAKAEKMVTGDKLGTGVQIINKPKVEMFKEWSLDEDNIEVGWVEED